MEWTRGATIGLGATATVYLATDVRSGERFAVKSAELSRAVFLQKEQSFLSKLSSPRIVKYLGFDVTTENGVPMYNLCIEYVPDGTLSDAIRSRGGRLDEPLIKLYTRQILQGLDHLHENGLAHCDIKSRNILIGEEGVKIADLGCSKLVGGIEGSKDPAVLKFSGTPVFMAPEVARGEKQGFEADIWALGCTAIEMATGKGPWPEMNDPVSALYRIAYSDHMPEFPRWFSEEGKDFLSKCLKREWRERWTVKQLLEHPFLRVLELASNQQVKAKMGSPNSVLDKDLWDSLEDLESHEKQEFEEGSSPNSAEERIKKLIRGSFCSVLNWSFDEEDWLTIRSTSCDFTELAPEEEELSFFSSSIFDEELSFDDSFEVVSTFVSERSFVMPCNVIVMEFQNENERSCVHEEEVSFFSSSMLDNELSFDPSVEIVGSFVGERSFLMPCNVIVVGPQNENENETTFVHEEELSFSSSTAFDEQLSFDNCDEIATTFVSEVTLLVIPCNLIAMENQNENGRSFVDEEEFSYFSRSIFDEKLSSNRSLEINSTIDIQRFFVMEPQNENERTNVHEK